MKKTFLNTGILMAAALTGIFSTTTMLAFADETEIEINLKNRQSGVASGEGDVHNCAENDFQSDHPITASNAPNCSDVAVDVVE
jgi:hypothetical protein